MKPFNLLLTLYLFSLSSFAQQKDVKLIETLKNELQYNMKQLKQQDTPPYYMSYRVNDTYNVNITSSFGAISVCNEMNGRSFVPQIRLGNPELDNFKYITQGGRVSRNSQIEEGEWLPLDNEITDALREAIWRSTLHRYEYAVEVFEQTKSRATVSVEDEDKAPCFSPAPTETYYEEPLPAEKQRIDLREWKQRLNEISKIFKSFPELQQGSATLTFECNRNYFINSEGTEIVQNRTAARIMLSASLKANDGMDLPLIKDYFAYNPTDLPDNATIIADAKDMVERLKALKSAPVADPFTGPAILSGPASGVFFHEIFGHRLEGHRMKTGGQTFKNMIGKQVLPKEFTVYCDPTLSHYAHTDLNGHYLYDDEGVKARRVNNVVNGILTEFLMSRIPLDGFPNSNGHGRTAGEGDPVSRQSNLIIETSKPYSEAELRAMLIKEAKEQGKEYGYYIRTVTSGFTFTGEGGSLNSFNVTPLEVYRVYVDGRPDELVRGVDMIGTPLSMFSNIAAAGGETTVFTGTCGAESGWVPVTTASPMIYVSQIETQRRAQSRAIPAILPAPEEKAMTSASEDDIIFAAMNDEMKRNLHQLALPDLEKPYYISYILNRHRHFQVTASLGGLLNSTDQPWQTSGSVQLSVGNYEHNNDVRYVNQIMPAAMPTEVDYYNIRRGFWMASDMIYRYALKDLAQKENILKSNPLPETFAALPDMQQLPATTHLQEREKPYEYDIRSIEALATRLSAIFKEYKDIFNSSVNINGIDMNIYRLTSEDVILKTPMSIANINISAAVRTDDGTTLFDSYALSKEIPGEFPTIEELEQQVHDFAERLLALKSAPLIEEYYKGPVLYENGAVSSIFSRNLLPPGTLIAQRTLQPKPGMLEDLFGRKIIDERLTIKNRTDLTEYNGTELWGHYTVDADGITPEKEMILVENGVLKKLLNSRYPTYKAPESTGSTRFILSSAQPTSVSSFGTMQIAVEKGTQPEKMKKTLQKAAKAAGLKYAYIIRRMAGGASEIYRINVKDGTEIQVRAHLSVPTLAQLEKLEAISSGEYINNLSVNGCQVSLICPQSIIINDVEFTRPTPKIKKAPAIPAPPLR